MGYTREYYAANREEILAKQSAYKGRNRQKIAQRQREYYQENLAGMREKGTALYRQNREKILDDRRDHYQANRDEVIARVRAYAFRNGPKITADRLRRGHGMRPEDWMALWQAQDGMCYLCGNELSGQVVVDHDHSCCPRQRSCATCRRGLAHNLCNVAIGFAGDDAAMLHRMADALAAAQADVARRKASAARQLSLLEDSA